ncbi:MAG: hydrogenase [Elusimicrobiota bacterium]
MNMEIISQFLILAVIFCNFFLLSSYSTLDLVKLAAVQGVLTALLPLLAEGSFGGEALAFAFSVIVLKGFFFPFILRRLIKRNNSYEEKKREYSGALSAVLYLFIFFISVWLSVKLQFEVKTFAWVVPASFMTIFSGLFLIILRSQTVSQIVGYMVLENGIYCFGLAVFVQQPLMVEAAILLDIFVAVFVMGMAVFHIGREFNDADSESLMELREDHGQEGGA